MGHPHFEQLSEKPQEGADPFVAAILSAIADPGRYLPRRRWPSVIADYDYESVQSWGARAAVVALDKVRPPDRWRPIDPQGNVAAGAAATPADDADEGETGPPEQSG